MMNSGWKDIQGFLEKLKLRHRPESEAYKKLKEAVERMIAVQSASRRTHEELEQVLRELERKA